MSELQLADVLPANKGRRAKPRYKATERTIIGIDGEGRNSGRDHLYTLLAASDGTAARATAGLSTRECFDYLLSLKSDSRTRYLFVGFSINYDVNMWLRDLDKEKLDHLLVKGHVYWQEYMLRWKPNRTFDIYNRRTRKSIHIYDVFGFFQCSFVRALRDWKVGDADLVAHITAMKEKRSTFTKANDAAVERYCFQECELLVQLVQRLMAAVVHAEIPCSQWYGVGALASGLLKKHHMKEYLTIPDESMRTPILCAYFGGRFEIAGSGHFGPAYGYDIKSAYPSVARSLPCLAHTTWKHTKKWTSGLALLHVRWSVPPGTRFGPFPWRSEQRRILYPLNGQGWHWSSEVEAAQRLFPKCVQVLDAYVAHTACEHVPYKFINDVYAIRQQYERAGDFAHKALKLALNALYGKSAQSLGNRDKRPPFQSYIWAGMITAGTRAQILDAIGASHTNDIPSARSKAECITGIISIATDGILSTKEIASLPIGTALGNWERAEWAQTFLVQPGIYRLIDADGKRIEHTRGFGHTETDFDAIERDYKRDPLGKHTYKATRFVGAASALAHTEYKAYWRKWIETQRVINFAPSQRFPHSMRGDPLIHDACTIGTVLGKEQESTAYTPKQTWLDSFLEDVDVVLDMDSM